MPVPVISDEFPLLLAQVGEAFNLTLYATESPTSWAWSNLPTGLSFNTTTGVLTGAPTTAGVSTCALTATNGSGTSAPINFVFKVIASALDDHGLVDLDFDLQTGLVVNPKITTGPQLFGKDGDKIGIALGLVRAGALRTLDVTNVKVTVRNSYDEGEICTVYDAAPAAPLDAQAPRYRLLFDLTAADILNTIAEFEGKPVPFELAAKIDIELTYTIEEIDSITEAVRTSVSFAMHLAKSLATP